MVVEIRSRKVSILFPMGTRCSLRSLLACPLIRPRTCRSRYVPELIATINAATIHEKSLLLCHNLSQFPSSYQASSLLCSPFAIVGVHSAITFSPCALSPPALCVVRAVLSHRLICPSSQVQEGYIDVWWIIRDGGLLLLIAHLLRKHRVWRKCHLRLHLIMEVGVDPKTVSSPSPLSVHVL